MSFPLVFEACNAHIDGDPDEPCMRPKEHPQPNRHVMSLGGWSAPGFTCSATAVLLVRFRQEIRAHTIRCDREPGHLEREHRSDGLEWVDRNHERMRAMRLRDAEEAEARAKEDKVRTAESMCRATRLRRRVDEP